MEAHIKSHSESAPPQPPTPPASSTSESSCSSSSDKENFKRESPMPIVQEPVPISYDSDIRYILYARDCLSPVYPAAVPINHSGVDLLAAAATVTERDDRYRQDVVFNLMKTNHEVVAALRHPAYFTSPTVQYTPLTSGDRLRRRVEAVLEVEGSPSEDDPMVTPPSSNPSSPVPPLSPPASVKPDPELSLPPRKRSKRILKSMETAVDVSPVRYSSVIQYARAS